MSRLVNCHVIDPHNVGDLLSSPLRYFEFPGFTPEAAHILTTEAATLTDIPVILGGGGLLFERFLPQISAIQAAKGRGKRILWGWASRAITSAKSATTASSTIAPTPPTAI